MTILTRIRTLLEQEMLEVNQLIESRLYSRVPLANEVSQHIIHSGGKRIRPLLVLLAAKALNCQSNKHLELAVIIEFIHTATLLHDDVVDKSMLRRGEDTANVRYGAEASVLVGDFLYSRAFQMMTALKDLEVMDILANTTNLIAEGEVLQLMHAQNNETLESHYLDVIRFKTAELFQAATHLGALAAKGDPAQIHALANYGLHLGMGYQIMDDVLDYRADPDTLGKNIGDDLAEGKITLPLIYLLQHGNSQQQETVKKALDSKKIESLTLLQTMLEETGAFDYCQKIAQHEIESALYSLRNIPDSAYKTALIELATFTTHRHY